MILKAIQESWKIALLMILLGFALTFLNVSESKWFTAIFWKVVAFTGLMWMLLWVGNATTSDWVSSKVSWTKEPIKRFWLGMVVMVVYTTSVVYLLVIFFRLIVGLDVGSTTGMIYGSLFVTFTISTFMHSRGFLKSWRTAEVEAEKAKQESISAHYESLKNQVNPHFLFNTLNVLTNLVSHDQEKAIKFIKQLSEVYRYVLDSRDKEVVPVQDEIGFLESYIFLQQIRFGNKLRISMALDQLRGSIPPLALQMLVENAIKHNVISEEHPLEINLQIEGGSIVVSNKLQRKSSFESDSPGVGLDNIRKRYKFLSDKPVEVAECENRFVVKLPVLTELS